MQNPAEHIIHLIEGQADDGRGAGRKVDALLANIYAALKHDPSFTFTHSQFDVLLIGVARTAEEDLFAATADHVHLNIVRDGILAYHGLLESDDMETYE
jgi:hypothetical protein